MRSWKGQRVVVIGAARQGLALARFLARNGAQVILTDTRPPSEMQPAVEALRDLDGIEWSLGGHPLELLDQADLVCVSGGVPLTLPLVQEAFRRGIPLSNDSQIFMEIAPCKTIGITGSAGKTTTTTLVGRIAEAGRPEGCKVWVGGNIGQPLIDLVDQIRPGDLVVLELSSFQLELMTTSPRVAAVLNITPNHLDRHGTMQAYTAAKAHILTHQTSLDIAVLGRDDPGAWSLADQVRGRLVTFGLQRPAPGQTGTYLAEDSLTLQADSIQTPLMAQETIQLRGAHNLVNVLAACAIAHAVGLPGEAMQAGVAGFQGVPHRLEFVRTWRGADWYNDSIATAPERTMAAIRSFEEPLVLLAGGRDKKLPWDSLADLVHQRIDHLVVFGEAADKILAAVGPAQNGQRPYSIARCQGLRQAVQAAAELIQPGDVVLLSPGGTSFDEFRDFEERGEWYRIWVKELS
ncbi:MAG TPA: UDP-N-acetylmuramoyl-L-alanine--D-glutamate ligase [Anaerolineaceae bacterium]|nr:UDP-N-acetylmuramoyl-L-alanine--D-glutamate ligase [Anaerolineaceae bacterium]